MKKALAILMIFALVASAAMAEITLSGWGRGIFAPVMNTGASGVDSTASIGRSWGMDTNPRVKFSVNGNSDNVGFQFEINADDNGVNRDGTAMIWVKPMDMITVKMGAFWDDTLRGNADFGSYNWIRAYGAGVGEDAIFTRFAAADDGKSYKAEEGFMVAVKPMDALYIGVVFSGICGSRGNPSTNNNGILTEDLFDGIQIGVGYTIDGVGQIRAQYYSQYIADGADWGSDATMEVAFKFTMIENLYADVGFRMFLNTDIGAQGVANEKQFNLYGNYKVAGAKIHAIALLKLSDNDPAYHLGAGVDYDVAGVNLEADLRFENDIWASSTDNRITFFAGVNKGFSNGKIGAGLQIANAADMGYAIPIRMEYWF